MSDQPPRVLVVDDDLTTRLLACEALIAHGFAPLEAEDGTDALAQYEQCEPKAILLDINMPGIDGYDVCRRLRLRPGGAAVSIMVMTASDDLDAVQQAFAAGATDFITKPLNLPLLAHRVRYMLRAAAAATAAREAATRLARAQRLARLVHWQLAPGGTFAWASDPIPVFWPGAPVGQARGLDLLSLTHPEDRERVAAAMALPAGHQLDFRLRLPDGSVRVVHQDAEIYTSDRGPILIGATQDITELRRAEDQVAQLAFYDDLTGIPNRQFLERYLRQADPAPRRAIVALDLGTGGLDRLPVAAHDAAIRSATARVIERVRGEDLALRLDQVPTTIEAYRAATLVARTGPDELVVVTAEPGAPSAAALARQLAEVLAAPLSVEGRELALRPRFGAVDYPSAIDELRTVYDQARAAMFEAERTAPRDIVACTAATRELRARRGELAHQLADALDAAEHTATRELELSYGPRVEPASRVVIGVRAHPRWAPAARDPHALDRILAADPSLRGRFAMWALTQACRDAASWTAAGVSLRLAVELPFARLAAPGFAAALRGVLDATGLDPGALDLELCEVPTGADELERTAAVLTPVRALGARLTLARVDDTSLGALSRLPLDTLRLDRDSVARLGPRLVTAVAGLARALELRLAAADLDSPAALAALDLHEPDELAGAAFGPGVPAAGVVDLTAKSIAERSRQPTRKTSETAAQFG